LLRYSSRSNDACITQVKRDKNVGFAFVDSLHNFNWGAPHPLLNCSSRPPGGLPAARQVQCASASLSPAITSSACVLFYPKRKCHDC
jgi:hypothetical protein